MRKIKITLFFIFYVKIFLAQNPLVKQWDKRYGGTNIDNILDFERTTDGGYILGAYSESGIGGDKTQPSWGDQDFWIVKTDSTGFKQWDKRFGGSGEEFLYDLCKTSDGGYILGGTTISGISGDITQPPRGTEDYWVVKISPNGTKQWQKRYGGNNVDRLYAMKQTPDGGYIFCGESSSDSTGDKSQDARGLNDYWLIKTDSLGNKIWDRCYGGSGQERIRSFVTTPDGGYLLAGESLSPVSGEKTVANWGGNNPIYADYWVVKVDSSGNKQWDKRYGGDSHEFPYVITPTNDGGYAICGYSYSGISGDRTEPSWGNMDYWFIKLDSAADKQWDKRYGGTSGDMPFGTTEQTADGGYLITGTSLSPASGDKTEGNFGFRNIWLVKTDPSGALQWDKTIYTAASEVNAYTITGNGCYVTASSTNSGIGGYKTQPNWDPTNSTPDMWVIKFCDTTLTTSIYETIGKPAMEVSPNPFNHEISITIHKPGVKKSLLVIKDILGQTVFMKRYNDPDHTHTKTIDLQFLSKGVYFLDLDMDGERVAVKIVRE